MATLDWSRRFFFTLVAVLGFVVVVEGLSYVTFWVIEGRPLSRARLEAERAGLAHVTEAAASAKTSPAPMPLPQWLAAEVVHPYLISAGAELARQGVQYHDLTGIFSKTPEPIYIDTCCHMNVQGNQMLATRIAEVIVAEAISRYGP